MSPNAHKQHQPFSQPDFRRKQMLVGSRVSRPRRTTSGSSVGGALLTRPDEFNKGTEIK
jgi:hypothetical protein